MYGPTIFQLSHLFDVFCQKRVPICTRKMAASARVPRHCVISRVGVTSRTCTVRNALKTRRKERNACVWKGKPDETGRK